MIAPQIVDQPYWAGRVAALGIGVAHDGPPPTVESQTAAPKAALTEETRVKAAEVAKNRRGMGR